eukprot:12398382-Karenia_brevis.AAC.1
MALQRGTSEEPAAMTSQSCEDASKGLDSGSQQANNQFHAQASLANNQWSKTFDDFDGEAGLQETSLTHHQGSKTNGFDEAEGLREPNFTTKSLHEENSNNQLKVLYLFAGKKRRCDVGSWLQKLCQFSGIQLHLKEMDLLI